MNSKKKKEDSKCVDCRDIFPISMEFDLVLRLLQIKQPLPWIIGYLYENRSYRYQEGKMFGFNAEGVTMQTFIT